MRGATRFMAHQQKGLLLLREKGKLKEAELEFKKKSSKKGLRSTNNISGSIFRPRTHGLLQ
jgi:hypothetical protein